MSLYLLDTDHWSLRERGHALVLARVSAHPAGTVGLCPITIEESLRGWLAILSRPLTGPRRVQAYADLTTAVRHLTAQFIVPFDAAAETQFQDLISRRLRIGTQDLKIAAVALAHKLILLTRNRKDFGRVPGLTLEDWSVP